MSTTFESYATQDVVPDSVLDAITDLPVMEDLDIPLTKEELRKVTDYLANGKAPESDGIPAHALACDQHL